MVTFRVNVSKAFKAAALIATEADPAVLAVIAAVEGDLEEVAVLVDLAAAEVGLEVVGDDDN